MLGRLASFAVVLLVCWGCGDDAGGDDDGVIDQAASLARDACHAQCEAQQQTEGCEPLVGLSTCRQLCDMIVRDLEPDCREEFTAYYNCSADQGFTCFGGLVTQPSEPCANALDELNACQGTPMCVGADDEGFCPSVDCPCPDGSTPVSGFSNESGECRCLDEQTCTDLFCD